MFPPTDCLALAELFVDSLLVWLSLVWYFWIDGCWIWSLVIESNFW